MHFSPALLLAVSTSLSTIVLATKFDELEPSVRRGRPALGPAKVSRRGEPETGDDLPDDPNHPSHLNQVETAFNDAIELTSYVKMFIDTDTDIYPHYFAEADRAEVKRIFTSINNGDTGNDLLGQVLVQTTDSNEACVGGTLSYLKNGESGSTETPYIVLCPNVFNKKAVTLLNGTTPQDSDGEKWYAGCREDGGEIDSNVSYLMNTLGMTLLHEYLHYDKMIASSFGSIVDNPSSQPGYGPVNVYDRLDKSLARVNADSYAYYASQVLWTVLCGIEFAAPRPGIDDADPDCGGVACQN